MALPPAHDKAVQATPVLSAKVVSPNQIDITCNEGVARTGSLQLWRSDDGVTWKPIACVPAAQNHFSDAGVEANTVYYYRLSAAGATAALAADTETVAVTNPSAPHSLKATPFEGDVILSWTKGSDCAGYEILSSSDGKSFHHLVSVGADTTTYRDWAAADGVTDYYKVRAWSLQGNSAASDVASVTPISKIRVGHDPPDKGLVFAVPHGKSLEIKTSRLFDNAVDPNNDPVLKLRSFTQPHHGTVSDAGDGSLTYKADQAYCGTDRFTYTPTDQYDAPSDAATVQVLVTDEMPIARSSFIPLAIATNSDGNRHPGPVKGTLYAHDPDGDPLTFNAKVISGPGTFKMDDASTGSYTFTPNQTDRGPFVVEFTANDGIKTSNKASLTFPGWTVSEMGVGKPEGDGSHIATTTSPPLATDRSFLVYQNGNLQVNASRGLLSVANNTGDATIPNNKFSVNGTLVEKPQHGTVTVNADGSFHYTPDPGFTGRDWFTARVDRVAPNGGDATAFVDVAPVSLSLSIGPLKAGDSTAIIPSIQFPPRAGEPRYATIHMTFPKDLPAGSLVTLSVNRDVQDKLDVYDGVPDVVGSKVLIGKHAGTNTYTWTVNGSKTLPTVVYAVGINGTDYGQVVLSLPVTIGQKTVGTARTSRPTTAPASTRP